MSCHFRLRVAWRICITDLHDVCSLFYVRTHKTQAPVHASPFAPHAARVRQDGRPASGGAPHERWEGAPSVLPTFTRPTLVPQTSTSTPSSSTSYQAALESRRPSSTAGFTPTSAGAASTTPGAGDNGQKRLPWEGKEARYVIGSGELGLLNELQMPRRGAIVPLDRDFLRLPNRSVADSNLFGNLDPPPPPPPAPEPLLSLDGVRRLGGSGRLFSPTAPSARTSAAWKRDESTVVDDRQPPRPPSERPPAARATSVGLLGRPVEDAPVGSADARAQAKLPEGGSNSVRADKSEGERTREPRGRGKATLFGERTDVSGEPAICSADASASPPAGAGSLFGGQLASAARQVETASAAEQIAAFRPGTRFRVAVDKGLTGLGITVKEIRGRFFVYKLQTLADGSPGAAEVRAAISWRALNWRG